MKYRGYRRKRKKVREAQIAKIAGFSGFPTAGRKIKITENGERVSSSIFDEDSYDYVKRCYRGHCSKILKKIYAKRLRNGKNKLILYKGSKYKIASGDFWWDIS